MLIPGLYEQVVNKSLEQEMSEDKAVKCVTEQIDKAEAPSLLAKYIAEIIEKGLRQVSGEDMSIVWKLKKPIPAKYLKKTNKLVG